MEDQTLATAEAAELTQTDVIETQESESSQEPQTPVDVLNSLITARTGSFDLRIKYTDLKYIKNLMQSKIEWKGSNEAYLTIMTILTLSNALEQMDPKSTEAVQIKLPASTFEALNYFLNKVSGIGIDGAQKLFSATMILRPTLEALKKLDDEIEALKAELKTEKTA